MPIQKAHAAFGHVLIRNDYADGEVVEATVKSEDKIAVAESKCYGLLFR